MEALELANIRAPCKENSIEYCKECWGKRMRKYVDNGYYEVEAAAEVPGDEEEFGPLTRDISKPLRHILKKDGMKIRHEAPSEYVRRKNA